VKPLRAGGRKRVAGEAYAAATVVLYRAAMRANPNADAVEALILDLLAFVSREERPYDELMEAWRTSCPRLPVWEEANARGLVMRVRENGSAVVRITSAGQALLAASRGQT